MVMEQHTYSDTFNTRRCFICGKEIFWGSFYISGWGKGIELDILEMIWNNPIFVIKCCECFYGDRFAIEEIERFGNIIKNRKKGELISW